MAKMETMIQILFQGSLMNRKYKIPRQLLILPVLILIDSSFLIYCCKFVSSELIKIFSDATLTAII